MCVYVYTDTGATHTQTLTRPGYWPRLATCLTLPLPPFSLFRLCFYAAVATSSASLSSSPLHSLLLYCLFFSFTGMPLPFLPSLPLLLLLLFYCFFFLSSRPLQQSCLHKVFFLDTQFFVSTEKKTVTQPRRGQLSLCVCGVPKGGGSHLPDIQKGQRRVVAALLAGTLKGFFVAL